MAHELTINKDGSVEFAYRLADGLPWHGLGQPMADNASIDEWRTAAGMDWKIKRSKIRYAVSHDPAVPMLEMPEQNVLFRSDTKAPLGVVSEKYKVVQPSEVLEFFRDIAKAGGLELSAAGTLFGGKRFWATAKIGEASPVSLKDTIGGFLLISTSADGSLATEVRRTTVRTVCNNTLRMAFADAPSSVKVSHKTVFEATAVKEFMGLNEAAWEAFRHQVVRLANVPMPQDRAEDAVLTLLGGKASLDAEAKVVTSTGYNKILDLFNGQGMGANLDGVNGTAWGLLNAITEYADHWARARTHENRFVSAQWGPNADLKQSAMDYLSVLA